MNKEIFIVWSVELAILKQIQLTNFWFIFGHENEDKRRLSPTFKPQEKQIDVWRKYEDLICIFDRNMGTFGWSINGWRIRIRI